jgi:hypothetical protein
VKGEGEGEEAEEEGGYVNKSLERERKEALTYLFLLYLIEHFLEEKKRERE